MRQHGAPSMIRFAGAALVALALVASACGKSNSPSSGGTSSAGGTTSGGATTGGSTSGGGGGSATVDTASVGSLGTVLVDSKGMTLYHLTGESPTKFICTEGCTGAWPPLEATAGTPTGGSGVTGTLDTALRPDGSQQVTYDGMPLYTFSGDTKPGDANGQGVQGAWFALTPDGKDAGGGAAGGTTGTTGGGYGRGY